MFSGAPVTGPAALPFIPFLRAPVHTFEQPPWVFLIQRQQLPGSLADLGQCKFDPPDLTFVPKPILAYKMKGGLIGERAQSHGLAQKMDCWLRDTENLWKPPVILNLGKKETGTPENSN